MTSLELICGTLIAITFMLCVTMIALENDDNKTNKKKSNKKNKEEK